MKHARTTNSSQAIELSQLEAEMEEMKKAKEAAEAGRLKVEKYLVDL